MASSMTRAGLALLLGCVFAAAQAPSLTIPGLEVQHWFSKQLGSTDFPVGTEVDVVVGVHNGAPEALNLTGVTGSINSPAEYRFYVQNFTAQPAMAVVPAGEEASVHFSFVPSPYLPPRDWQLTLLLFGESESGSYFQHTFYNQTVSISEPPRYVDTELVGLVGLLSLALAGIAYVAYSYVNGMPSMKSVNKRARKQTAPARIPSDQPVDQSQWLKGTHYDQAVKARMKRENSARKLKEGEVTTTLS